MYLTINIKGRGTVEGGGEHPQGSIITLTALPDVGWDFKKFDIDGSEVTANPFSFPAGIDNKVIAAKFYVTIEGYLRGLVDFDVPDSALNSIMFDRGISMGDDASDIDKRTRDLCYADVLMWGTTTASTIQGESESDNGWSHTATSRTLSINDKRRLEERAMSIYNKYSDAKGENVKSVKIVNLW